MVRPDDGTHDAQLGSAGEIGADLPHDLAGLVVDDPQHVGLTRVHDDVAVPVDHGEIFEIMK